MTDATIADGGTAIKFIKQPENFGYRVVGDVYQQERPFEWVERDWNNDGDVYSQKVAAFHEITNVNEYANNKICLSEADYNELIHSACIELVKPSLSSQIESAQARVNESHSSEILPSRNPEHEIS